MVRFVTGAQMAQLVLTNISPAIVKKLEQRAKRSGRTVEAEAMRLLEAEIVTAEGANDAEIDALLDDAPTEPVPPEAISRHEEPSGGVDSGAQALAARQAALADSYPNEYVVLLGDRVIAHTQDKEEAYAQHDAAFEGDVEPIILPPGALRRIQPPVIRGRALVQVPGGARK
ncbi:MAG: FitA-like ribbon-helix-helix domain-containing protein [Byssovorax sp.]